MNSYKEMQPYIGNDSQLIGYQEAVLSDGASEGVRIMMVYPVSPQKLAKVSL